MKVIDHIRKQAMRGGYCYHVKKYHGPIWKYDLNQAYAAAMRDAQLPAGPCTHVSGSAELSLPGIARVTAITHGNKVPFYYRDENGKSVFGANEIINAWITHSEIIQLRAEKWNVEIHESYHWAEAFNMRDYVYKLETARLSAAGGVNGATGLMIKAIGNNSYGKSLEEVSSLELIMALEQPDGYGDYMMEDENISCIWYRFQPPLIREYHQPQIGAMITAHVRMQVRQAALLNADAWLYADTDCVMFSEPVNLNPHPTLYGRWKVETEGEVYYVLGKKIYAIF
jgi:hypothetical protein